MTDFESYERRDFRDFVPEVEAQKELRGLAAYLTRHVLEARQQSFGESRRMRNMQEISVFLGGLTIQPFGKLSYVDTLEPPLSLGISARPISTPGVTSNLHRQSFVIDKNISASKEIHDLTREEYVDLYAVHELVHLAGIPDILYCLVDWRGREVDADIRFAPTVLETPGKQPNGTFLEEGFATLCSYVYLWGKRPEIAADKRAIHRRSPKGVEIALPVRHSLSFNTYDCAAWALERAIDFSPRLWSILLKSRRYGVSSEKVRGAVKAELDRLHPRLFEAMDLADVRDLEHVVQTAKFTDGVVERAMRG